MSPDGPGSSGRPGQLRSVAGRLRRRLGRRQRAPAAAPALASPPVPVFFLVGRAKSGTSWLMNLLDAHPAIVCRGEGRFFGTRHRMGAAKARSLEHALLESAELRDWASRSSWTRGADYERWARALAPVIAKAVMAGALEAEEAAEIVGDKTPLNGVGVVAAIGELVPEARVIHIIRDGRDVAVSSIHHRWNELGSAADAPAQRRAELETRDAYRADPEGFLAAGRSIFGAGRAADYAESWAEQTNAAIAEGRGFGPQRYAEVRYEDLLADGAGELARLFGFLGVEATPELAERCLEANRFEELTSGRPAGVEDSAAFLRSGTAGDWRRVLNPSDREDFKRVAGETLVALGYEAGTDW